MSTDATAPSTVRSEVGTRVLERPWRLVVWIAMTTWSSILFADGRALYHEFQFQRYDLGNMVQAVWSTAHGRFLETTFGTGEQTTRLASHVDPILALLTPLWILVPTPLMLIAVQIVACALGALPVFWLGRRHLSEAAGGLLALAYLSNPWLIWTVLDAIHPATFAIPLFLYCIWFLDSDRLVPFAACGVLAATCGELMGLPIAVLGIWFWVRYGRQHAGLVIATGGVLWTILALEVVIPASGGGTDRESYKHFESIGGSPAGVLRTALTDPGAIAHELFTSGDVAYVLALAAPLAGLFVLAPLLAAAAAPQLLTNSLSSVGGHIDPRTHTIAAILPFLIAATVLGIARLPRARAMTAATLVLALSAGLMVVFGPRPGPQGSAPGVWLGGRPSAEHIQTLRYAVDLVPADAPVAATTKAGSHLSARRYFFNVPAVARAEWVLVDVRDSWVPIRPTDERGTIGSFDPARVESLVDRLARSPRWETAFDRDGVYVFRRTRVRPARPAHSGRP